MKTWGEIQEWGEVEAPSIAEKMVRKMSTPNLEEILRAVLAHEVEGWDELDRDTKRSYLSGLHYHFFRTLAGKYAELSEGWHEVFFHDLRRGWQGE